MNNSGLQMRTNNQLHCIPSRCRPFVFNISELDIVMLKRGDSVEEIPISSALTMLRDMTEGISLYETGK